jgi:hypothetical protein
VKLACYKQAEWAGLAAPHLHDGLKRYVRRGGGARSQTFRQSGRQEERRQRGRRRRGGGEELPQCLLAAWQSGAAVKSRQGKAGRQAGSMGSASCTLHSAVQFPSPSPAPSGIIKIAGVASASQGCDTCMLHQCARPGWIPTRPGSSPRQLIRY